MFSYSINAKLCHGGTRVPEAALMGGIITREGEVSCVASSHRRPTPFSLRLRRRLQSRRHEQATGRPTPRPSAHTSKASFKPSSTRIVRRSRRRMAPSGAASRRGPATSFAQNCCRRSSSRSNRARRRSDAYVDVGRSARVCRRGRHAHASCLSLDGDTGLWQYGDSLHVLRNGSHHERPNPHRSRHGDRGVRSERWAVAEYRMAARVVFDALIRENACEDTRDATIDARSFDVS
jgi:hypothetical protein